MCETGRRDGGDGVLATESIRSRAEVVNFSAEKNQTNRKTGCKVYRNPLIMLQYY